MRGTCLVTTTRDISDVLAQNPDKLRKVAMFQIISIPSDVSDEYAGQRVYVRDTDNSICSFITNRRIHGLKAEDLMFIGYVEKS